VQHILKLAREEADEIAVRQKRALVAAVAAGVLTLVPSLSTSGETLTIEESMTLRARMENAGHVGDEHEWSQGCG
jgi:hypothetical protein